MAIIGQLTLDQVTILEVDSDPTSSGVAAAIGSLATIYDGVNGRLWIKTASGDTGWTPMLRLATGTTALAANTLVYTDANGFPKTDTTKFTWDQTNGRLGIGLSAPATPVSTIHIDRGTGVGGHVRFTAGTTTGQTSGDGFEIGIDNAGNAELIQFENSNMNFFTNNTLVGAFSNTGKFLVGATSTPIDITGASAFPQFQIIGTAAVQMAGIQYSADTIGPVFNLLKSRGASIGTQALVSSGDEFGRIQFRASDGVNFQAGASIRALVDGTASAGSMPGYMILMTTPSGSTTPVERMRISQNGLVRVVDALQRRRTIMEFDTFATANTTTTLTTASASIQITTGSTAGQIIKFPDATTLVVGAEYEIRNSASVTVAVQDNAGGALDTIPAGTGTCFAILTANGTAAGTWYVRTRFKPYYNEVSSTAGMSLASTTDVLVTSMTLTPPAGTYRVFYDSTITNASSNNGQTCGCGIYAGGSQVANSGRSYVFPTSSFGTIQPGAVAFVTSATVTVNGAQAIEVRARRSAGTVTINNRTLNIIRVA